MNSYTNIGRLLLTRMAAIVVAAGSIALINPVLAGDNWLSRVTTKLPSRGDTSVVSSRAVTERLSSLSSGSATVLFDVTISLDTNPLGDDNYKLDGGTTDSAQKAYERRIEEFAKAVFQSSNGVFKIGKITIFRSKPGEKRVESADVLWDENCDAGKGPRANLSGFGVAGAHIWMCTNWPGAATLMATPKGSGYTLAHEWGHYTYGLYDEYAQEQCASWRQILGNCHRSTPRGADTPAVPAIMNNQWTAAETGGSANWLEYSTSNIHPFRSDSTGTNAQKRVFGESAWQTLTRDAATDPKSHGIPERTHYLSLIAPSSLNWLVSNDEATALSDLDIRWAGSQVNELLIDTSGSMDGAPMSNAKTGANLLIDSIQSGSAVGVSSFNTSISRNFAIVNIPEPDTGVKAGAKAAVNAFSAAGRTSLYDGLMGSLRGLQTFSSSRPSLVFVLSDGGDNDSTETEASVIAAYQAAQVPIISFAYGTSAPTGTLFAMANATGGAFYQSPTTLAQIQAALIAAKAKFSSSALLSSSSTSATASTTSTRTITLDSTLASARINLTFSGTATDFDFRLILPNGAISNILFTCEGGVTCSASLNSSFFASFGYGDYQIQMVNKTAQQKDVAVLILANPSGAETYNLTASFSTRTLTYPADLVIRATASKGPAIAGLNVVAVITTPTGAAFNLVLLDDGVGADLAANDGIYSASTPYAENGVYSAVVTADNYAANASTTYEGVGVSLREDGTAFVPTPTPITERFVRIDSASTSVVGYQFDDHANNPAGGACTLIASNNVDTLGRIDAAGDTDCLTFVPTSVAVPLVVRVTSLSSGMSPILTVYNHTGSVQLAQVNLATSEGPASGAIVTLPANLLDAGGMVITVKHVDTAATTGAYAVSVGSKIISDSDGKTADSSGTDLVAVSVVSPTTGKANELISVSAVVKNKGTTMASPSWLGFFLSTDTSISNTDINTQWGCVIPSLGAGEAYFDCQGTIPIPANTSAGTYYLGAIVDLNEAISETNESNNSVAATNPIVVSTTSSRLINLSTRGQVQTGDKVMIGGFIIGGATPKKVLIRAVGPNLRNYGVSGVLADPTLQLFSGSTPLAYNDDWLDASNSQEIQASGLAPAEMLESAILTTLSPGAYTAIVSGTGGGTGVGIVEVYELDQPGIPLINISTRGQVQTGDNVMIGGFIIQGDAPKTVLIRAVGPTLASYGVTGVLGDPTLKLYSGSTEIASNDDWGTASNATDITATGLAPAHSRESAILVTLPPGAYTAIVSGFFGDTGVGIVEVFGQ